MKLSQLALSYGFAGRLMLGITRYLSKIDRWGVWSVSFPHVMQSYDDARRNLESILPELKKKWKEWLQKYPKT